MYSIVVQSVGIFRNSSCFHIEFLVFNFRIQGSIHFKLPKTHLKNHRFVKNYQLLVKFVVIERLVNKPSPSFLKKKIKLVENFKILKKNKDSLILGRSPNVIATCHFCQKPNLSTMRLIFVRFFSNFDVQ